MRLTLKRSGRQPALATYEREDGPLGDGEWIEHLDGTDWFYAMVPPRRHECWPQTRGRVRPQPSMRPELVERCACGALRFDGCAPWVNRNSSKPQTAQEHAEQLRQRDHGKAIRALISEYQAAATAKDWPRCTQIRAELRELDAAMEAP